MESVPKQEKAKLYQKKKQILTFVQLGLSLFWLLVLILTPLSLIFKNEAQGITGNGYGVCALYFVFLSVFFLVVDFPLSIYSGFILEHRFELSNQTLGAWMGDFLKKSILSLGLSLVLIEALFALIWHFPSTWWWIAWAGLSDILR
jgi:STE24 endopeptidase